MKRLLSLILTTLMISCSSEKEKLPEVAIVKSHSRFFIENYVGNLESNNNLINKKVGFKDTLNGKLIYLIPNNTKVSISFNEKYPGLKELEIKRLANNVYEVNKLIYASPDSTSNK